MSELKTIEKQAKDQMAKAVDNTQREMSTIRSGKATTSLLDTIRVDAYGQSMPLTQVASVGAPEPRMLTVQPWDKGLMQSIEKALQSSDLGLNPSNDGTMIRVPLPPLTEERRRELVRVVHQLAEDGRIGVRHVRTDALHQIKKVEHVSEDDKRRAEKNVQKLHDDGIAKIDGLVQGKEEEIMEV